MKYFAVSVDFATLIALGCPAQSRKNTRLHPRVRAAPSGYAGAMAVRSLNSTSVLREEYKGWTLYVRWHHSFWGAAEGWICKPIAPQETARTTVSLGRQVTSAAALAAGRAWVDRKVSPLTKKSKGSQIRRRSEQSAR